MKNTRTSVNIWNGSRKIALKDEYRQRHRIRGFGFFETCFFLGGLLLSMCVNRLLLLLAL